MFLLAEAMMRPGFSIFTAMVLANAMSCDEASAPSREPSSNATLWHRAVLKLNTQTLVLVVKVMTPLAAVDRLCTSV